MTYETLIIEADDTVAHLYLNRVKAMNTFNAQMAEELPQAFMEIAAMKHLRCVTIQGKGPVFMAGGDIKMMAEKIETLSSDALDLAQKLHQSIELIRELPVPVLGAVHGAVAGAGMSIMMACDCVIASETTDFSMAYNQIGASPDGGATYFLPRLVGMKRAAELIFLSERFNSQSALSWGLINWVVADAEFAESTQQLVSRFANGPTSAYQKTKALLNAQSQLSLSEQLSKEAHAFAESTKTKDFKQGVNAFLQKKVPSFVGE